jgi:hypothetical protein
MAEEKIATVTYGLLQLGLIRSVYRNEPEKVALYLEDPDGETFEVISINVPGVEVGPGEFVVNHDADVAGALFIAVASTGKIEDTGRRVDYGGVLGAPVWRLVE